jgi:hypothetical protein
MDLWSGIGRGTREFFNGLVRGVSNPREDSKILAFLYRTLRPLVPTVDCRAYLARPVPFVGSCEAPRNACSSYVAKLW